MRHDSSAHCAGAVVSDVGARILLNSESSSGGPPGQFWMSPVSQSACRFVPRPKACTWYLFPHLSSAKPACSGWWISATKWTIYFSALSRSASGADDVSTLRCRSIVATTQSPSGQSRAAS